MRNIKEAVKKLVRDWRFYAWITGLLFLIFFIALNSYKVFVFFSPLLVKIEELKALPYEFWVGMGIATLIILAVALCLFIVCPLAFFALCKIRCYISLTAICLFKGYKIRLSRIPFAALFGIRKREDIRISVSETNYYIHFIDIPFCLRRKLVMINENAYCITKEIPDGVANVGGGFFRDGIFSSRFIVTATQETQDARIKEIPEFTHSEKDIHVIISSPKPIASKVVIKNRLEDLYSGSNIGNLLFFTRKGFIKFLKR